MDVKEFLETVDKIIKPTCKLTPVVLIDAFESKKRGIESKVGCETLYDFKTGKITYELCSTKKTNLAYIDMSNKLCKAGVLNHIYFEYLPEYNATAICLLSFDCSDYKIGEKRDFKTIDYYFITEDKYFVYKKDGVWVTENNENVLENVLPFSYCLSPISEDNFLTELAKQYGLIKVDGRYNLIRTPSDLKKHIFGQLVMPNEYKISKELKSISDEILDITLPPIILKRTAQHIYGAYAKLEYVNPEISVIRWFIYVNKSLCLEYLRYYITDKANFACILENDGRFHAFDKNINEKYMLINGLVWDKEELKDSKFKYYFDIIDGLLGEKMLIDLYNLIKFELLEKFAKTGFGNFVNYALSEWKQYNTTPYETIQRSFSVNFPVNETDIYKALGINKHQYKKITQTFDIINSVRSSELEEIMCSIRILFKNNKYSSISDIDDTTFDKFFDMLVKVNSVVWNFTTEFITNCVKIYSLDAIYSALYIAFILCDNSLIRGIEVKTALINYVDMANTSNDPKSFPLKFKHFENVDEINAVIDFYNSITQAKQLKAFYEQLGKCKKWEYIADEYSVISPNSPGDIAKEGAILHHCVSTYIDIISKGNTNVLFIRKTDDIEKPFFTVEISNEGSLEQVHGFANKNANTEPGLEDFIKQWTIDKKITTTNYNKTR